MIRARHPRPALHRRMGSRGQPEESRAAILEAAAQEFAEYGIAGARTDAIAREARVNKALLYYYFKDKETLYGAVLDDAFSGLKTAVFRVLDGDLPARDGLGCVFVPEASDDQSRRMPAGARLDGRPRPGVRLPDENATE